MMFTGAKIKHEQKLEGWECQWYTVKWTTCKSTQELIYSVLSNEQTLVSTLIEIWADLFKFNESAQELVVKQEGENLNSCQLSFLFDSSFIIIGLYIHVL